MTAAERQRRRRERQEDLATEAATKAATFAARQRKGARRTREQMELERFEHGFSMLLHAVEHTASMLRIAKLSPERARQAEIQLRPTSRALRALRAHLKGHQS